jgi:hypothetical protein
MIHAVNAELITPGSIAQPIIVKASRVSPKRTTSKKRARKNKNNVVGVSCPAAMASIAVFLVVSFLIILSQMNCFNMHFGLPKSITDTKITHSANGSYMDMYGSAQVQLDAAGVAQLKAHTESGGGPLTLTIPVSEIPNGSTGRIPISPEQIRKALLSQQRRMRMPMPMPATMKSS